MNWIAVAREFRESDDVLIFDRLADRLAHAEREVLEIEGLKHQLRHTVQAFIIRSRLSTPGQMDVLGRVGSPQSSQYFELGRESNFANR